MIQFYNHEVSGEPITNFNDIIKYIWHEKPQAFIALHNLRQICLIILSKRNRLEKCMNRAHIGGQMIEMNIFLEIMYIKDNNAPKVDKNLFLPHI